MKLSTRIALVACAFLGGCAGLEPPSPEFLARIEARSREEVFVRRRAKLVLESSELSGTFTAVLVARLGPKPLARLQLFPAVGPKVLDLSCDEEHVIGSFPQAGETLAHTRGDRAPRHPLVFIAATLLEGLTPISTARVLGMTDAGLHLTAEFEGASVIATLGHDEQIVQRAFELRRVRWVESISSDEHRIEARNFAWSLSDIEESVLEDAPDASLFRLDIDR